MSQNGYGDYIGLRCHPCLQGGEKGPKKKGGRRRRSDTVPLFFWLNKKLAAPKGLPGRSPVPVLTGPCDG